MAEVRLSMEEYERLLEDALWREGKGFLTDERAGRSKIKRPSKKKGTPDPKMSRALVKANKMGRKKAGGYKKGWNQGKIMRKAHQLRRRM